MIIPARDCHAYLKALLIGVTLIITGSLSAQAQETGKAAAAAFQPDSCLAAASSRSWPAYCTDAQRIHDRLTQRTRTAPVELKQLKELLWEKGDQHMWQFLALSLAERSPYFSSTARRLALMDEIDGSVEAGGRPDAFVLLASATIRVYELALADQAAGLVAEGQRLLEGEKNRHLLALWARP